MSDVDTIDGKRRRNKRWPDALKREIVAATLVPGASVSVVARQYDVNANQVFMWRRRYRNAVEQTAVSSLPPTSGLVPVAITPSPEVEAGVSDTIEIEVSGDCRVRVGSSYVRYDHPFGGRVPPAAMFYYSRDRGGDHIEKQLTRWSGLLQADAYSGYNRVCEPTREPGLILEAACWAHARRPFFALADIEASARRKASGKAPSPISPLALEVVRRIDALFEIERGINGSNADERRTVRQELSRPLVDDLEALLRAERPKLSRGSDLAKAMDYMLKRWPAFARFLDDGRVCLTNNAAERALRGIALGRKSWLFAGSDRGGARAAAMYSLIVTAKLNDIDPQAWLADVLTRIAGHPASKLDDMLPWNWRPEGAAVNRAA